MPARWHRITTHLISHEMPFTVYYGACATASQPDYYAPFCEADNPPEKGRIRSFAFIAKDYLATLQADPTDSAIWVTGILDKKIIIIPTIAGDYDGGSPVTGPGYGDTKETTVGYDHVITYRDPNYKLNAAFYNAIKYGRNWVPAWRTETQTHIADNAAQIIPKAPISEDLASDVAWNVEVRFSQPDLPIPFDTPAEVFIPFAYNP